MPFEIVTQKIPAGTSLTQYTLQQAKASGRDAFATISTTQLHRCHAEWTAQLPRVRPCYAVKCNPHPVILQTLQSLGCGFDCASPNEMRLALQTGCAPRDIIYANPQKTAAMIREAYELGVDCFTFDSEAELRKMVSATPEGRRGRFVLRLLPPDESKSVCKFGVKFGANEHEAQRLVRLAAALRAERDCFDLHGVSFHVGSGCFSVDSFRLAVEYCGRVAALSRALGQPMRMLDLGGGYMTDASARHYTAHGMDFLTFPQIAAALNAALDDALRHFADGAEVIAEPGRFFAGDCITLAVRVFGRRVLFDYAGAAPDAVAAEPLAEDALLGKRAISEVKYYVGDGMYGWFNAIVFDHVTPHLRLFDAQLQERSGGEEHLSHIFGPTCDSMDCILRDGKVPLLEVGDWIVCEAFGAYTQAAATEFNGIPLVPMIAVEE